MGPTRSTRSEAAAAAAPATTNSGRVKKVSQAALRAMSSENHEVQQARRARTGTRGSNTNASGQRVATSIPKVTIAAKTSARSRSGRSPLTEINNTVYQRVEDHRAALTLPIYSASRLQPQSSGLAISSAASPHASPQAISGAAPTSSGVPKQSSTASTRNEASGGEVVHARRNLRPGREEPMEVDGVGEGEDNPSHSGWHDEEDGDDGTNDDYVPSDMDGDEDQDGVQLHESTDNEQDADADNNGTRSDAEETEQETAATVKIRARRNSKKVKKTQPKASDYGEDVEALLNHAAGLMRALVMSEKPMPSVDESIDLASDAYELTKTERPHVQLHSNVKYIPILRQAIPQVRGKVKDAARARTSDAYSFDDRPRMGQKNRCKYLTLIENDAYIYEKPEALDGPYYHPLCYKIVKTCFFSNASDDGILFSEFFNPVRPQTVALIYTAIRMCLDEWKTGSHKPLNFTSDLYEPIYASHLANLKALDDDDPLFLKGLGDELWEDCSEPFDIAKITKPMVTIGDAHKANGIKYGQERRNARAAQKAAAAAATTAAAVDMAID